MKAAPPASQSQEAASTLLQDGRSEGGLDHSASETNGDAVDAARWRLLVWSMDLHRRIRRRKQHFMLVDQDVGTLDLELEVFKLKRAKRALLRGKQ